MYHLWFLLNDVKVYLIHGINLKPERMNELGGKLAHPFEVIALPGHRGDSTRKVTKESLLEYAKERIDTDDCAVIGFSLGGLIATALSFERSFKKICLIAPAIYPRGLKLHLPLSRALSSLPVPIVSLAPAYYNQNRIVHPNLFRALFELAFEVYNSQKKINCSGKVFFHKKDRLVDVSRSSKWIEEHTSWEIDFIPPLRCLFNHMLISDRSYAGFSELASRVSQFLDS